LKKKGFILISVLFMVIVLIILMTSLIALTTQTLYRATLDMTRSSLIVISDSALVEVLILLTSDPLWGENNEKLFMKSGEPDMKIAGFNPLALPKVNSQFDFENNTAYYITFDPNDTALGTNKCFSVNNLDSSAPAQSWRPGIEVPPYTADIVITVMEDGVVRHVEALIMRVPDKGWMQNGSRGQSKIYAKQAFSIDSKYGPPNFHSNYDKESLEETSITIDGLSEPLYFYKDATISACDNIMINGILQGDTSNFKPDSTLKDIPNISISTLVNDITFSSEPLPSGTYEAIGSNGLRFTSDITGVSKEYYDYAEIVPGVIFEVNNVLGQMIAFNDNIQIEYDSLHLQGTGNINIIDIGVWLGDSVSIYAPGEEDWDPNTGIYEYGNFNISNSRENSTVVSGYGNLYAMGTINLEGPCIDTGIRDSNKPGNIALYSQGDISLISTGEMYFFGLIYTCGDFISRVGGREYIEGALIAAGKDESIDPSGFDVGYIDIEATRVYINFNDMVLKPFTKYPFFGSGGGTSPDGNFRVISWYEF